MSAELKSQTSTAAPTQGRFAGKRVIVTGASAGIGKATAIAFAQQGATVAVIARRKNLLDELIAEQFGGKGFAVAADFFNLDQVTAAVKEAVRLLGGLDVLVNNVGGSDPTWSALPYHQQLSKFLSFNLDTVEYATDAALPALLESKGAIVNVGSLAGTHPYIRIPAYSVAKAALHHSTKVRATMLARKGVTVNVVAPGAVRTDIRKPLNARGVDTDQLLARMAERQMDGQIVEPEDVAESILFLSDKRTGGHITAAVLPIDGGAAADIVFNVPDDRDFRRDY